MVPQPSSSITKSRVSVIRKRTRHGGKAANERRDARRKAIWALEKGPMPLPKEEAQTKDPEASKDSSSDGEGDEDIVIDTGVTAVLPTMIIDQEATEAIEPLFAPLSNEKSKSAKLKGELRTVPIPPHRMAPLQKEWINIFTPLTEMLGLQVRMNLKKKAVEMRTSSHTKETGAIQKGADYVKAFALGFSLPDAIALLRIDDLYLDSFEIKDVKSLSGDHLSRAIGRIAGHDGKTKFTIENTTRTRIILADTKIHIMGSFQNIRLAKDALVNLILGSPPGKVYASLRTVASRMKQRSL